MQKLETFLEKRIDIYDAKWNKKTLWKGKSEAWQMSNRKWQNKNPFVEVSK